MCWVLGMGRRESVFAWIKGGNAHVASDKERTSVSKGYAPVHSGGSTIPSSCTTFSVRQPSTLTVENADTQQSPQLTWRTATAR